jgi:hypothetical protein
MALDQTAVAITGLIVFQGAQLMGQAGPKIAEVRTASGDDPSMRAQVQAAEISGAVPILAAGAAISWLSGDARPLIVAVGAAVVLIGVYECLLAAPPAG